MTFRKQLIAERERLNLTQSECAKILGVGKRTIQTWEDDRKAAPNEITQEGALARLAALPSARPGLGEALAKVGITTATITRV